MFNYWLSVTKKEYNLFCGSEVLLTDKNNYSTNKTTFWIFLKLRVLNSCHLSCWRSCLGGMALVRQESDFHPGGYMSEELVWAKNSSCSKMEMHHYQGHCVVLNTLVHLAFPANAGKRINDYNSCLQFSFLPNDLSTSGGCGKKRFTYILWIPITDKVHQRCKEWMTGSNLTLISIKKNSRPNRMRRQINQVEFGSWKSSVRQ